MDGDGAATAAHDSLKADLEQVHAQLLARSPIYNFLLADLKLVSVQPSGTGSSSTGLQDAFTPAGEHLPSPPPIASVLATLPLKAVHLNSHGSLHGAVAATIVDWAGGIVIASLPRAPASKPVPTSHGDRSPPPPATTPPSALTTPRGVSVDIHLRYLSPAAKLDDVLLIRASSRKIGRSLAFVNVELAVRKPVRTSVRTPAGERGAEEGAAPALEEVCVVEASHTKYIA